MPRFFLCENSAFHQFSTASLTCLFDSSFEIWIIATLVLLFALSGIAAGVFSSSIVQTSNLEVLVSSPHCRMFNFTEMVTGENVGSYSRTQLTDVKMHVQQCYQNITDTPEACRNIFVQPKITFTIEPAACPWNSSMCLAGQNPAVAMDSGLLDASRYFGWNLKTRDGL